KAIPFGLLVLVLGAWGFFVPLVGPYFSWGFDTTRVWQFSEQHWTLSLIPGVVAAVGGLLMMMPARASGWLGGLLAGGAGIWFAMGPAFHPLWSDSLTPHATSGSWKATLL